MSASHRNGAFVVVVGPDGVGKTSVARAMAEAFSGPTAYFHFLPPLRRNMAVAPPERDMPPLDKGSPDGSRVLGWLRLSRNIARFWLGYLFTVRPAVRRGFLVIGDRWAHGYVAQPKAVKFYGPRWLARIAVRALPRPDLVANLVAPPDVIRSRKQELTSDEIERELAAWAQLPVGRLHRFETVVPPREVAARILQELDR